MPDGPADRPDPEHQTVLEALSAKLGDAPKLSLKDDGSDAGHSPAPTTAWG